MSGRSIRLAAALCVVVAHPALAENAGDALGFLKANPSQEAPADKESGERKAAPASAASAAVVRGNVHRLSRTNAGAMARQTGSVSTGCLRPSLVAILNRASSHFGSQAVVTSGFRRGRGFHAKCMAADVQIAGVSPGALARYFRAQPDVGGVGTYGHTRSVHVDVAERKYSWHGRSSRRVRLASAG